MRRIPSPENTNAINPARGLVLENILSITGKIAWQALGESNPSFQVENLAS